MNTNNIFFKIIKNKYFRGFILISMVSAFVETSLFSISNKTVTDKSDTYFNNLNEWNYRARQIWSKIDKSGALAKLSFEKTNKEIDDEYIKTLISYHGEMIEIMNIYQTEAFELTFAINSIKNMIDNLNSHMKILPFIFSLPLGKDELEDNLSKMKKLKSDYENFENTIKNIYELDKKLIATYSNKKSYESLAERMPLIAELRKKDFFVIKAQESYNEIEESYKNLGNILENYSNIVTTYNLYCNQQENYKNLILILLILLSIFLTRYEKIKTEGI